MYISAARVVVFCVCLCVVVFLFCWGNSTELTRSIIHQDVGKLALAIIELVWVQALFHYNGTPGIQHAYHYHTVS